jgi:hypothetical protein
MRFFAAILASLVLLTGTASAQDVQFKATGAGTGIAVYGILGGWGDGYGVGGRYIMPLVPGGFLKGSVPAIKKDSVELEAGVDFVHFSWDYFTYDWSWNILRPAVGAKWTLWLSDKFAVYPKLDIGFDISWYSNNDWGGYAQPASHSGFFIDGAGGLLYQFSSAMNVRLEGGNTGLRAGVGITF